MAIQSWWPKVKYHPMSLPPPPRPPFLEPAVIPPSSRAALQRRKRSVSLIVRIKLRVGGAPEPFNCFKIFDMLKVGEEESPPTGQSFSVWVLPGRPR